MATPAEELARRLALAGQFGAEALELNRRLAEENPSDIASRTRLARCYREAGQLDLAEAEYREVLRLDPRNRIAAGGLELVERERRPPPVVVPAAPRRPTPARVSPGAPARSTAAVTPVALGDIPQTFTGFGAAEFAELAGCPRGEVHARFAPRVVDLVRRVNALGSSVEIAGIREAGKRQLFRAGRADVHAAAAHWHVFNLGGRTETQFNVGMSAGHAGRNWFRIGVGFSLAHDAGDRDDLNGRSGARDHFRRFQALLASPRRSLFLGWMVKEEGRIEDGRGPRADLHEPSQAAAFLMGHEAERSGWIFFGKWLSPERPDDAAVLADPVALVRAIDRVFTGLIPLWRALWE